jgi:hypothetical protein
MSCFQAKGAQISSEEDVPLSRGNFNGQLSGLDDAKVASKRVILECNLAVPPNPSMEPIVDCLP